QRPRHRLEPRGRPSRRRARPAPGQGRGAGSAGRSRARALGREDARRQGGERMTPVDVFDAKGMKAAKRELSAEIFEAPVNVPLMHQVVVAGLAGIRSGTHKVKTRGEVRGGGKKPWRQKGTGRARQGSIRAPQWAGGGVAHGPVLRDHTVRVNKKMKRGALRSALTDARTSGKLILITETGIEAPRTKDAIALLRALE